MSESNKSFRIKANAGADSNIVVNLTQDYDVFEVLSVKINQEDTYKIHSANYGVIVGRVLANNGFGVPNAKISIFIEGEFSSIKDTALYPYSSTASKDGNGIRYNLLVDQKVDDCHQAVGTFPNKTYLLDNDDLIEIFDKYYKYTTRTNNSGDYLICGVPTGSHTLHMDLDLSDCGILSQRPRDFVYKGYTIEQFENPNQFKTDTELDALSQIFSQDQEVNVIPFWGEENNGESIGITRADVNVKFKFEPTCVFMGSLVGDSASNGLSKKCVPTNQMGAMDELTTGEGTIEMIRKTMSDDVEEFQIKGTQLIDANGVWCYQIPMNLDYMATDEYGNMVPTDDPERGIPTRTRVRFRISMQDFEANTDNYFRAKVLVPHNPQDTADGHEDYDYEFGTYTQEESYRDLFWNNVYTVKSYIPRIQKSQVSKTERFTGIKHCNIYGNNNPMPYNNIRIRLPLMFTLLCALIKSYIRVVDFINRIINFIGKTFVAIADMFFTGNEVERKIGQKMQTYTYIVLADGLCPDLDSWYFSPNKDKNYTGDVSVKRGESYHFDFLSQTFNQIKKGGAEDSTSVDATNADTNNNNICLTTNVDYLVSCIEMNLAQEYKVINFDFYNDWVNGVIYMPRWMKFIRKKRTFLFGLIKIKSKVKACLDDSSVFGKTRRYVQQCALTYRRNNGSAYTQITTEVGCTQKNRGTQKCHKTQGLRWHSIFGSGNKMQKGNGGAVHETKTSKDQYVYYFKPCEWGLTDKKRTILFANDIVLLGSLNDCNLYGIPQAFKHLTSSSYVMPTNLALTNMDDDGYLYSDGDGTICSETTYTEDLEAERLDPSFSATAKYYSTTQDETVEYGKDSEGNPVYDDTIPLTEAAGIAWNYTGPGQGRASEGREVKSRLYQPGGHFLGISCTNAETNIKSCINLQRICEAGSTMSQRREEVRYLEKDAGGTPRLSYRYFIPTGLIAQDEVVDGDFRSMFATMNHNRLLCDGSKVDEKTGYPIYDFLYLRPNGFDGKLNKQVNAASDAYNNKVSVDDEYTWMANQGNQKSDDYDSAEKGETYAKTLENVNNDYYMFRMGLNSLSTDEQDKRFLYTYNGAALPQYENSLYFYFGLKDGATALDEFTKQFFSTCESDTSIVKDTTIIVNTVVDEGCLTGTISVNGRFISTPMEVILLKSDNTFVASATTTKDVYEFSGREFGNYVVTVTDVNEETYTKNVNLGSNSIAMEWDSADFNFRTKGMSQSQISSSAKNTNSGFFTINSDFTIGDWGTGSSVTISEYNPIVIINTVPTNDGYIDYFRYPSAATGFGIDDSWLYNEYGQEAYTGRDITSAVTVDKGDWITVYLWRSSTNYSLYLYDKCDNKWRYARCIDFTIDGIDSYDLYLGSTLLPYSDNVSTFSGDWWNNIGADASDGKNWAMRHALFRQTDNSAETYTNQVYALDENGREIDTVLFGQPEYINSTTGLLEPYVSSDNKKIWYENDNAYEGDLSDDSILPTWSEGSDTSRQHFMEMAYYNNMIVSNSVGQATIQSTSTGTGLAGSIRIEVNNPITGIKIDDGCIAKLSDGTVIYPVKVSATTDASTYDYYGDIYPSGTTGTTLEFHPLFKYPVMDRPFYANMDFLVWNMSRLDAEIDDDTEETTFTEVTGNGWRLDKGVVHNGITFQNFFGNIEINGSSSTTVGDKTSYHRLTFARVNGGTDLGTNCIIDRNITHNEVDEDLNNEVSFYIQEGAPSLAITKGSDFYKKINKPRTLELAEIEGNVSYGNMVDEIRYYKNSEGKCVFSGNSTMTYYLFNAYRANDYQQPLIGEDVTSYKMPTFTLDYNFIFMGRFNSNATAISTKNKENKVVQCEFKNNPILPGNELFIILFSMYSADGTLIEITASGSRLNAFPSTITPYSLLNSVYTNLDSTIIGKKGDMSFIDYLKECGIDVTLSYIYNTGATVPTGYSSWIDYYDKNKDSAEKIIINGESSYGPYNINDSTFVVSIASAKSGTLGSIRVGKIYPKLRKIKSWSGGGGTAPYITLTPTGCTYDNCSGAFKMTGGTQRVEISANVGWTLTFTNIAGAGYQWLSIVDEITGAETKITDGYTITGNGSTTYTFKAKDNSGYGGQEGVSYVTPKTKISLTGFAIKATLTPSDASLATSELEFFLEGKKNKMYITVS